MNNSAGSTTNAKTGTAHVQGDAESPAEGDAFVCASALSAADHPASVAARGVDSARDGTAAQLALVINAAAVLRGRIKTLRGLCRDDSAFELALQAAGLDRETAISSRVRMADDALVMMMVFTCEPVDRGAGTSGPVGLEPGRRLSPSGCPDRTLGRGRPTSAGMPMPRAQNIGRDADATTTAVVSGGRA